MITDKTKLLLLAASIAACLSTLLTSSSFQTGSKGLQALSPPRQRLCKKARSEARECVEESADGDGSGSGSKDDGGGESRPSCSDLLSEVSRCERAVERAYRHINMVCASLIQARTVCELEWCENVPDTDEARKACIRECYSPRDALERCSEHHVTRFFRRAGLRSDGTAEKI
uniref:Uncharacterized protein n=1 Tax=Trieres chinensis TaxID=1514140 RepID=A0A7S1Z7N7_TRICV